MANTSMQRRTHVSHSVRIQIGVTLDWASSANGKSFYAKAGKTARRL